MRSGAILRSLVALACVPSLVLAHERKPDERALLQVRTDATELLYEVVIPSALEAAKWRLTGDTDRNGRLSETELAALAQTMAVELVRLLEVDVDGARVAWKVLDAKLQDTPGKDRLSGRLALIVLLGAPVLRPGVHALTLTGRTFARGGKPLVLRIETDDAFAKVVSVTGGGRMDFEDGAAGVSLRNGQRVLLSVDVAVPDAGNPPKTR